MEALRPGIITLTCKNCKTKKVVYRTQYDEHNHLIRGYLICEACSYILLPKRFEGRKVTEF
jgi:hypothetical protein